MVAFSILSSQNNNDINLKNFRFNLKFFVSSEQGIYIFFIPINVLFSLYILTENLTKPRSLRVDLSIKQVLTLTWVADSHPKEHFFILKLYKDQSLLCLTYVRKF